MSITRNTHCELCQSPLPLQSEGRGRPRQFCSDECAKVSRALDILHEALPGIMERSPQFRKYIRGTLFRLGNCVAVNRKEETGK